MLTKGLCAPLNQIVLNCLADFRKSHSLLNKRLDSFLILGNTCSGVLHIDIGELCNDLLLPGFALRECLVEAVHLIGGKNHLNCEAGVLPHQLDSCVLLEHTTKERGPQQKEARSATGETQ